MSPRTLPLLVSGLVFTLLAVGLPMLYLDLRLSSVSLFLLALPALTLTVALLSRRRPALTHFAFPVAHLPILLAHPELSGPRVYAGPSGLVAFLAVVGAGAAYLVAASPRLPATRARPELLVVIAATLALAPLVALTLPALATEDAAWPALTCLVAGPLIAWWLVARGFVQQVALPALDPSKRSRSFYALRNRTRARPMTFVVAAVASALSLGLLAFWYLWSPR